MVIIEEEVVGKKINTGNGKTLKNITLHQVLSWILSDEDKK
jgi:hypothetical protein